MKGCVHMNDIFAVLSHSKKRLGCLALGLITLISLAPAALGATVSMEYSLYTDEWANLGEGVNPAELAVSDMREDGEYYYFLLGSATGYRDFAVARVSKTGGGAKIYSVNSLSALEGYMIDAFDVDDSGGIWLKLFGDSGGRLAVIRADGSIGYADVGDAIHYAVGSGVGVWADEEAAYIWDGSETTTLSFQDHNYSLAASGSVVSIAVHDGAPVLIFEDGELAVLWSDELASTVRFFMPNGRVGMSSAVSAGGMLWASASMQYSSVEGGDTYDSIAYSGLVPIFTGSENAVALGGEADTILYAVTNADGSAYFIMRKAFPIAPNSAPGDVSYYYAVTVTGEGGAYTAVTETLTAEPARKYADQNSGTWSYGLEPGITVTKPDGTTVAYVAPGALESTDITVTFNGAEVCFDAAPYIQNGRTMAPIRGIAYLLGAEASWDQDSRTATFVKGGTTIEVTIGADSALVNGEAVALEAPAEIADGRTMVPLRFISEAFGAEVDWINGTRTVTIGS